MCTHVCLHTAQELFILYIHTARSRLSCRCEILCASSAWHRLPMIPSHWLGRVDASEPRRNECRWQSDLHSIGGNGSLLPQCLNILQCRHFVTCPYMLLLDLRSQLHSPEQQNGLPTLVHIRYPTQYGRWTRIRSPKWSALRTTLQGI